MRRVATPTPYRSRSHRRRLKDAPTGSSTERPRQVLRHSRQVITIAKFRLFVSVVTCFTCLIVLIASSPARAPAAGQNMPNATQLDQYEAFRFWLTKQPVDVQQSSPDLIHKLYADELRKQGKSEKEIASTIETLSTAVSAAEVERWNRILTAANPAFNTAPNAFLGQMTRTLKPGRALDAGMGQGRNTIYLAQQGWDAVGFDPADRAVDAAKDQAAKLGVKITTHIDTMESFAWGQNQNCFECFQVSA